MKTCTVTVQVFLGPTLSYKEPPIVAREWKGVNIMNTSHTRAWATRQFNKYWKRRKKDTPIHVEWDCQYDDGTYHFKGSLSGVNHSKLRRGIFE